MGNCFRIYIHLQDLKKDTRKKLPLLAEEIRSTIIEVVGKNGGHLASNLGVVELTIALHRVLTALPMLLSGM